MTDRYKDLTSSSSSKNVNFDSSLESYSNFFDKDLHNFANSSEISLITRDQEVIDQNPSPSNLNETFTKTSRTIINAFTGKPISPNPWRKLCSKNTIIPIQTFSSDVTTKEKNNKLSSSRRQLPASPRYFHKIYLCKIFLFSSNTINNEQVNVEYDSPFEQCNFS